VLLEGQKWLGNIMINALFYSIDGQFRGQYTYLMAVNWLPAFLHWRPVRSLANRQ